MKKILIFLLLALPLTSHSAWTLRYNFFYNSWEDDVDNFSKTQMNNNLFIGASFDKKAKLFIGPSYNMWSKTHQPDSSTTESDLSLTEFGARIVYFLNKKYTWKIAATYNISVKGDRTVGGTSQDVSGTGYLLNFGYMLPMGKSFRIGASFNYHVVSISESKVGTTSTDVSQTYTTLYPMIEFALRFR